MRGGAYTDGCACAASLIRESVVRLVLFASPIGQPTIGVVGGDKVGLAPFLPLSCPSIFASFAPNQSNRCIAALMLAPIPVGSPDGAREFKGGNFRRSTFAHGL